MKFPALLRLKPFFFVFLILILCSLFFIHSQANAQSQNYQTSQINSFTTPNTNPDVPNNLHTYSQSVFVEVASALICQLSGIDVVNRNQQCLGIDPQTHKLGFVQNSNGLIGVMGSAIAMTYNMPVHTSDFTTYMAGNFGLTKPAYAAAADNGSGFAGLAPLFPLWIAFRNIVYLLFVLIFVVIGLAIMLRVHIDPRTVMSVQNQIPKIIIGILLVTFSMPIAGFLIDLMFVIIYLLIYILTGVDPNLAHSAGTVVNQLNTQPLGFANEVIGGNVGGILKLGTNAGASVGVIIHNLFANYNPFATIATKSTSSNFWTSLLGPIGIGINTIINGGIGDLLNIIMGYVIATIVGILAILIILIAIVWALFRLWFALISSYIFLLLDIIMAPFWIVAALMPGSPIGFGQWFRDVLSNLAAFPTAIAMIVLGRVIMDAFNSTNGKLFYPPLINNPAGSGNASGVFGSIIGLGFILMTPKAVEWSKNLLKATKFDTKPIAQAIGVGQGVVSQGTKDVAGDIFSYSKGNYPNPSEKGATAVIRRVFGKF